MHDDRRVVGREVPDAQQAGVAAQGHVAVHIAHVIGVAHVPEPGGLRVGQGCGSIEAAGLYEVQVVVEGPLVLRLGSGRLVYEDQVGLVGHGHKAVTFRSAYLHQVHRHAVGVISGMAGDIEVYKLARAQRDRFAGRGTLFLVHHQLQRAFGVILVVFQLEGAALGKGVPEHHLAVLIQLLGDVGVQLREHRAGACELQLEVRALQGIVSPVQLAVGIVGVVPLGHAQGRQEDVGAAVALFPAVQHFAVVDLVEIVGIYVLNLLTVRIHRHLGVLAAVPGGVLEVGVDDAAVGADVILHQHVHVVLVDAAYHVAIRVRQALVHDSEELAGQTLVRTHDHQGAGGIGLHIRPGFPVEGDFSSALGQHGAVQREHAVAQRILPVRIGDVIGMSGRVVQRGIVLRPVLLQRVVIQVLGYVELHPVAPVDQGSVVVERIQRVNAGVVGDHRRGEDLRVVFLHLRVGDCGGRCGELPGAVRRVLRVLLVGQIHAAAGIGFHQGKLVSSAVGVRALQLAEEHLAAVGRHLAAVWNKLPGIGRLALFSNHSAVQGDGGAVHGELAAQPTVGADLGGGDLQVRGVVHRQCLGWGRIVCSSSLAQVQHKGLSVGQLVIFVRQRRGPGAGSAFLYGVNDTVAVGVEYRHGLTGNASAGRRSRRLAIGPRLLRANLGGAVIELHHEAGFRQVRAKQGLLYRYGALVLDVVEGEAVRAPVSARFELYLLLDEGQRLRRVGSLHDAAHVCVGSIQRRVVVHYLLGEVRIEVAAGNRGFGEIVGSHREGQSVGGAVRGQLVLILGARIRGVHVGRIGFSAYVHARIDLELRALAVQVSVVAGILLLLGDVDPRNGLIVDIVPLVLGSSVVRARIACSGSGLVLVGQVDHTDGLARTGIGKGGIVRVQMIKLIQGIDRRFFVVILPAFLQEDGGARLGVRHQNILQLSSGLGVHRDIIFSASRICIDRKLALIDIIPAGNVGVPLHHAYRDGLPVIVQAGGIVGAGAGIDLRVPVARAGGDLHLCSVCIRGSEGVAGFFGFLYVVGVRVVVRVEQGQRGPGSRRAGGSGGLLRAHMLEVGRRGGRSRAAVEVYGNRLGVKQRPVAGSRVVVEVLVNLDAYVLPVEHVESRRLAFLRKGERLGVLAVRVVVQGIHRIVGGGVGDRLLEAVGVELAARILGRYIDRKRTVAAKLRGNRRAVELDGRLPGIRVIGSSGALQHEGGRRLGRIACGHEAVGDLGEAARGDRSLVHAHVLVQHDRAPGLVVHEMICGGLVVFVDRDGLDMAVARIAQRRIFLPEGVHAVSQIVEGDLAVSVREIRLAVAVRPGQLELGVLQGGVELVDLFNDDGALGLLVGKGDAGLRVVGGGEGVTHLGSGAAHGDGNGILHHVGGGKVLRYLILHAGYDIVLRAGGDGYAGSARGAYPGPGDVVARTGAGVHEDLAVVGGGNGVGDRSKAVIVGNGAGRAVLPQHLADLEGTGYLFGQVLLGRSGSGVGDRLGLAGHRRGDVDGVHALQGVNIFPEIRNLAVLVLVNHHNFVGGVHGSIQIRLGVSVDVNALFMVHQQVGIGTGLGPDGDLSLQQAGARIGIVVKGHFGALAAVCGYAGDLGGQERTGTRRLCDFVKQGRKGLLQGDSGGQVAAVTAVVVGLREKAVAARQTDGKVPREGDGFVRVVACSRRGFSLGDAPVVGRGSHKAVAGNGCFLGIVIIRQRHVIPLVVQREVGS